MKKLLLASTVTAVMLASAPTHALTFDFAFMTGVGTVTGEIDGLTDNNSGPASAVYIDTYSGNLGSIPPASYNTVVDAGVNTFTVTSGVLTFVDYNASFMTGHSPPSGDEWVLALGLSGSSSSGFLGGVQNFIQAGSSTFAAAKPRLPAALPLFATGLGAMGLLGWRRKRKAAASRSLIKTLIDFGGTAATGGLSFCADCCGA